MGQEFNMLASVVKSLGGLAAFGAVYVASLCIYRLFFHPYAKYPGPFLAKLSNGYAAYHAWKGDIHIDMWRCHQKYGDKVRYAPNRLMINTPGALKDTYSHGKNFLKSTVYDALVHRAPNILTLRSKKEQGRRRRILSQGLSEAALRSFDGEILSHACAFRKVLLEGDAGEVRQAHDDGWSPPRNVARWAEYLTFDIMSSVVLGARYNLLTAPEHRYVMGAIDESNVRMSVLLQEPEMVSFKAVNKRLFPKAIAARNQFIRFVNKVLRAKLAAGMEASTRSIWTILRGAKDPETLEGFTIEELGAECTTLIVAGADTSSVGFASLFFYLTSNAGCLERVKREVRGCFEDASEIHSGPKLNSCVYLRACIDEAMRLSPPAGSALWREAGEQGAMVDGAWIPAGYDVGTCIYSIHHNEAVFDRPFDFVPERWIPVDDSVEEKERVNRLRGAFTPFSLGPRSCLGRGMAIAELMLSMALLIKTTDFKRADGSLGHRGEGGAGLPLGRHRESEFQLYDHITGSKDGPYIQFRAA